MPTRNVVLTDHHEALIERLVSSGRYQNASEVLRAGLRILEREDVEHAARLAALRAAVQLGLDDVAAGHVLAMETEEDIRAWVEESFQEALRLEAE